MRSSSASSTSELEYKAFGEAEVKEGPVLVPALPLHELLAADKDTTCSRLLKAKDDATDSSDGAVGEEQDYSALFDTKYASSLESDDEDARLGGRKRGKTLLAHGSPTGATLTESAAYFGLSEVRRSVTCLTDVVVQLDNFLATAKKQKTKKNSGYYTRNCTRQEPVLSWEIYEQFFFLPELTCKYTLS